MSYQQRKFYRRLTQDDLVFFSQSERTVKKYPLHKAISLAKANLVECGVEGIDLTAIRARDLKELVTLLEVNQMADRMVLDTLHNK